MFVLGYFRKVLKRPELIFVALSLVFGVSSAFILPILEVPDENQHFQVEYTIFSANGQPSQDLIQNETTILNSIDNHTYDDLFSTRTDADTDSIAINTNKSVFGGFAHASIFDIMRLPQAIGILVARQIYPSLGFMAIVGRLSGLAVYIVALYFIIKYARYGKWTMVLIAASPMMIQQAASLSYDGGNLIIIFAWLTYLLNTYANPAPMTKKNLILGLLLAILMLGSKQNNILLFGLLFAFPLSKLSKILPGHLLSRLGAIARKRTLMISLSAMFGFCVVYVLGRHLLKGNEFHPFTVLAMLARTFIIGNMNFIDATFVGVVGQFSNFYYHLPAWIVAWYLALFILVLLWEKMPTIGLRYALLSGGLFFGSILLISVGMYYGWGMRLYQLGLAPFPAVADGIQGRYFTPLLLLLLPSAAYLTRFVRVTVSRTALMPILIVITCGSLLSLYLIQTWNFFWRV